MTHSRQKPPWLRTKLPSASAIVRLNQETYVKGLATVCREARCPNQGDCWERGTATFLILGDRCTRDCGFCAVRHGVPGPVNHNEPNAVAESVASMGLGHAVITSVTRDDLPDGGASVFAETVRAIRSLSREITVEVLVPDFRGCAQALDTVLDSGPDVLNHNIETVPRLYPALRAGASYSRSLDLLASVAASGRGIVTKSGIMVGVGETPRELEDLMTDLARAGVRVLTIGQYLQPSPKNYPVHRYVTPEEFHRLRDLALDAGIEHVESGPLVRSSYRAGLIFADLKRLGAGK